MSQNADIERLANRVRLAAREGGLIETAQVKLVGLDEVRAAAGSRWPRMREFVREGSVKIIASRIGPSDAVISCGDGFLVVFADGSTDETERICREISDVLIAFYLGEEALSALRADVRRENVSAANLADVVANATASSRLKRDWNELRLGRFWPVWSSRKQALVAHLCAPAIEKQGAPQLGYTADFVEKAVHRDRDHLDLDLCLLEQACAAAEGPHSTVVGVTVHATTMQNRKARTTYLAHVAENVHPVRHCMFVSIAEIEPGTPMISLSEWCNGLKHSFSRVALDLHHSDRAISALGSAGIWAAGYHLPAPRVAPGVSLRQTLNHIDRWCRSLRGQGLQPFINGFGDAAFFDLASCSDVSFATGEALWPSRNALSPGAPSAAAQFVETSP